MGIDILSSVKEESRRPSSRPDIPPKPQPYRPQVLDPLGLVAGMFAELGLTEVIEHAIQQAPAMRLVTAGHAVKAMGLNRLVPHCFNQPRSLVPHFCQNKPPLSDTLMVTALSSRMAAPAAMRLGLAPRFAHLDSTSFHVDGRYNSAEEPAEHVMHITRGSSRDQRPDLNQVMLDLLVEHQAGLPVLHEAAQWQ